MVNNPQNLQLANAKALMKQGQLFEAYQILEELNSDKMESVLNIHEEIQQNLILVLNLLIDRFYAASEESNNHENEVFTFLNILNLTFYAQNLVNIQLNDKNIKKKSEQIITLLEKWGYKLLSNLKNTELKKKNLKKHYRNITTLYCSYSSIFKELIIPSIEDLRKSKYQAIEYDKLNQNILKEIIIFYISLIEEKIKEKNIILSHIYLSNLGDILNKTELISKFSQKIDNLNSQIAELAADFEVNAGLFHKKKKNFEDSILFMKNAYNQYRLLKNTSKMEECKSEYLNVCILSANLDLDEAEKNANQKNEPDAIYFYKKAIDKLEQINAKNEIQQAQNKLNQFYSNQGDVKQNNADKIQTNTITELNKALNLYQDAYEDYLKSNNNKKKKDISIKISNLSKLKFKILQKEAHSAHKENNFEEEFVIYEELHMLCYELENQPKAQSFANILEKLRPQVNFDKLEQLKKKKLENEPWITQKNLKKQINETKIINKLKKPLPLDLPASIQNQYFETTPFFDPEKNYKTKDPQVNTSFNLFMKKDPNPTPNKDLSNVYKIIKKFNKSQYLTNEDIQTIFAFGINLPEDIYYYHRFKNSPHQFYVHIPSSNKPQILMIPTKNLVSRKTILGNLVSKIAQFLPTPTHSILPNEILEEHINFVMDYPNWEQFIEGFQFSTLDCYIFFLHAIRLFLKNAPNVEIAKFLNTSVIAEYLNTPTEKLEQYLYQFKNCKYFEEILSKSPNENFSLFFIGLKFLQEKRIKFCTALWSLLYVS